jgi:phage terminase Nu1 subunit (DNA packaging protein)
MSDYSFQVSKLPKPAQAAIKLIFQKLTTGKVLCGADVGILGYTLTSMRHKEACDFFHVAPRALYKWVEKGAPRNEDGTYDLYKIHAWLLEKDTSLAAPSSELENERVRKLKLENDETEGLTMLRADCEAILSSRAISLRNFFERGLAKMRPQRAMRSTEELINLDYEFIKVMMEAYTGALK